MAPLRRFHSTSEYKGTGFGTSICKQGMDKMQDDTTILKTSSMGPVFRFKFLKENSYIDSRFRRFEF